MPFSGLLRRLPQGGAIVCFHGIRSAGQPDGGGIHVDVSRLAGVLDVARSVGEIVPVESLIERHAAGRSTSGLIAITFDDACLSVRELAAPVLRAAGAPASIFAVRDAAEAGSAYWWDRLSFLEGAMTPRRMGAVRRRDRSGERHECGPWRPRPRPDHREVPGGPAAPSGRGVRCRRGADRDREV